MGSRSGELYLDHRVTSGSGFWGRVRKSAAGNYAVALLLVGLSLVLTLPLQRFFPYPFLFLFFAAVIACAWIGGVGPGMFAVLLSTAAIAYYFVPPIHSFATNATDGAYFAAFVLCALVASWISSAKKRDHLALGEARDQLEVRVAERTNELQHLNAELEKSIRQKQKAQQALVETQAELAHLSRFLTMGELAASIAHEVNQPLTAVVTFGNACLQWLSANPPNLAEARLAAERIVADGTRASGVLSRIRSAFHRQPLSKNWFDLNEAITELVALMQHEASRSHVVIRTELAKDALRVKGDRVQLQQVVLNLLMNAIDATREKAEGRGEIVIRSIQEGLEAVRVSVEDEGPGVSPDIEEKIFEPFFTTKPQGIGMGLSISRSIIESHNGRLSAGSKPAGGAIVEFILPVSS